MVYKSLLLKSLFQVYRDSSYYRQKKAQYVLIFTITLMIYFLPVIIVELVTAGISPVKMLFYPLYYLVTGTILFQLKKGRLTLAVNLLILSGFGKAVELLFMPYAFHFYLHIALCVIIACFIHIRKYQIITSVVLFNSLVFLRAVFGYFNFTELGDRGLFFSSSFQAFFSALIISFTMLYLNRIIEQEIEKAEQLEKIALTDTLTGLANRRKLERAFDNMTVHLPLIMLLIDLDHFKLINDDFGHDTGDRVLADFSEILRNCFRDTDSCFRWGGEEFVVLMENVPRDVVLNIAERLRETVENHDFGISRHLTVSIGFTEGRGDEALKTLFRRADMAMYQAKQEGRNRLVAV